MKELPDKVRSLCMVWESLSRSPWIDERRQLEFAARARELRRLLWTNRSELYRKPINGV